MNQMVMRDWGGGGWVFLGNYCSLFYVFNLYSTNKVYVCIAISVPLHSSNMTFCYLMRGIFNKLCTVCCGVLCLLLYTIYAVIINN